jgi:hypothetical protein
MGGIDEREIAARRKPSTGFPIVPLGEAVEIIRAAARFGTDHSRSAFAQYMGHATTNSGAFKGRLASFRDWGLITTGADQVVLTELGKQIALPPDPQREVDDLRAAFRHAAPFAEIFDTCAKGQPLDLETIANTAVHRVGIAPASKERFVGSFARSVVTARLGTDASGGRLVLGESSGTSIAAEPMGEAPARADETLEPVAGATIRLPWNLTPGSVLLEIRMRDAIPPAAFAKLAAATEAVEELVDVLRASQTAATPVEEASES